MLVLSRNVNNNDSVIIVNNDTKEELGTIHIVSIQGACVKLGFKFKGHVGILRNEVHEKLKKEDA